MTNRHPSEDEQQQLLVCSNSGLNDDPCVNPDMSLKDIEKKIDFTRWGCIIDLLCGVGLPIVQQILAIYTAVPSFLRYFFGTKYGNYSSVNTTQKISYINEGAESYTPTDSDQILIYYLLFVVGVYLSVKSYVTHWRENKEELLYWASSFPENSKLYWFPNAKSWWTFLRFVLHFCQQAPAAREIELAHLGWKSKAIFRENDISKTRDYFKQMKSSHQVLTSLQHRQNCFESGPMLWFKMHLLCKFILSGNDIWSYGFWNLFLIGVGMASCTWKVVSNRRSVNLSDDYEKRMSWRKHISLRFIGHSLAVWVRFSLLGALSASSLKGFGILCAIHLVIVLMAMLASYIEGGLSFLNVSPWGSCWNKIEDIFHILDVPSSSLFSFLDFDVKKIRKSKGLCTLIYYVLIIIYLHSLGYIII